MKLFQSNLMRRFIERQMFLSSEIGSVSSRKPIQLYTNHGRSLSFEIKLIDRFFSHPVYHTKQATHSNIPATLPFLNRRVVSPKQSRLANIISAFMGRNSSSSLAYSVPLAGRSNKFDNNAVLRKWGR